MLADAQTHKWAWQQELDWAKNHTRVENLALAGSPGECAGGSQHRCNLLRKQDREDIMCRLAGRSA